jgi:hypothetical protein
MAQSMTQSANFTIPARLVFRPKRARWVVGRATITGRGKGFASRCSDDCYKAVSDLGPYIAPEIGCSNAIHMTVRLEWENMEQTLRGPWLHFRKGHGPLYCLSLPRDPLPSGILLPHEKQYQAGVLAGREFRVIVCVLDDWSLSDSADKSNVMNAWQMRSEFLQLEQETDCLCSFLNRWGHWNNILNESIGNLSCEFFNGPRDPINVVIPGLIWSERQRYVNALVGTSHSWLSAASPINLNPTDKPPYLVVDCWSCKNAIESTITIDHLSKVKFSVCKRADCRKLFKRTTRQRRFYCSPACAHLANVRQIRAQKKAERKRKGAKQSAKGQGARRGL